MTGVTGAARPIERVVVLMMENASFDRMVGGLRDLRPALDGFDPAHPGSNPDGSERVLQGYTRQRNIDRDPRHDLESSLAQMAGGTNAGFVSDFVRHHPRSTDEERREVMGVYPCGFLPALHGIASQGVVCDRWFASVPGPTWTNRLFAHSGTSLGQIDEPGAGLLHPGLHLYDQRTLYDALTDAGIGWRIYFGDVPQSLALLRQWTHLGQYRRFHHFANDVASGDLPSYVFIEPTYFGPGQNDQHPPHDVMRGDALIAEVFNTLQAAPDVFARTLLVVLYDEHGGFYDHVVPPATVAPDTLTSHFGFDRLGFRVPAVLVSPMLEPGVERSVFDHTSLLRMASGLWPGVAPLGLRAAQAADPVARLSWRATPRLDMAPVPVAPDIQPARPPAPLRGLHQSLTALRERIAAAL